MPHVPKHQGKPDKGCFRPLIRGFFFYDMRLYNNNSKLGSFRPLIRGFFFYLNRPVINNEDINGVSVPSFGDSFFIDGLDYTEDLVGFGPFPSPHSGILFLWVSQSALRLGKSKSFPSPHSGILFLCTVQTVPQKGIKKVSVPSFGDSFFILSL